MLNYIPGQLYAGKKLEAPAGEGKQEHKGKIPEKAVPRQAAEHDNQQNARGGNHSRLDVKFVESFSRQENKRRRQIEALLNRRRPALRDARIPKPVKKTAQKRDI